MRLLALLFSILFVGQVTAQSDEAANEDSWAINRQRIFLNFWDNPALTGAEGDNNLNLQSISNLNTYYQYDLAYDWRMRKLKELAFGVSIQHTTSGSFYKKTFPWKGPITHANIQFASSYLLEKGAHSIRSGVSFAYIQARMDWEQFTFGDMIDPRYGFIYYTQETMVNDTRGGWDLNLGVEYSFKTFYFEAVVNHASQPKMGWQNSDVRLPSRYRIHGGVRLAASDKVFISPYLLYENHNYVSSWTPGLLGEFGDKLILGFSYNDLNKFTLNAGYLVNKKLRLVSSIGVPTDAYMRDISRVGYLKGGITYFIKDKSGV